MEISRYPLCWPDNVARTAPSHRTWPRFAERTIANAISFLIAELNRLNGRPWDYRDESVIISSNLRLKQDGLPSGQQVMPADTGVAVFFRLRFYRAGKWFERSTVLTCDKWLKVSDNLTAIAKDVEAQRARQRWGCTSVEQAFQGYVAIPERCGAPPWWTTLGLDSTAAEAQIKDAYRTLAARCHPDVGGSPEEWDRLRNAYEQALASAKS